MALSATFRDDLIAEALSTTLNYPFGNNNGLGGPVYTDLKTVCLYDGTQPVTADTALTTQNLLVRITYVQNPYLYPGGFYTAAVKDVTEAYMPFNNTVAYTYEHLMDGTITWFRAYSDDDFSLFDGTVGTSSSDLVLPLTTVNANRRIHLDTFNVKMAYAV